MSIPAVLIIDLEVNPQSDRVFKLGAYRPDRDVSYESDDFDDDRGFLAALDAMAHLTEGARWLMGHNILAHDLRYLRRVAPDLPWLALPVVDTLHLSPLAFPQNPYHRLIKNHKIIAAARNSPAADCRACWQLFQDQCAVFARMRAEQPDAFAVFCSLSGVLPYRLNGGIAMPDGKTPPNPRHLISAMWRMMRDDDDTGDGNEPRLKVCRTAFGTLLTADILRPELHPALAYALAWLGTSGGNSVPAPWVRQTFPEMVHFIDRLRNHDCGRADCRYCAEVLNPDVQLQRYFHLSSFRAVEGIEGGQRAIVQAGMNGEHVLAVLPTGGGKSLCYQLPALNRYYRNGGLTVVISPLQSLTKDQCDGLMRKGIGTAHTLNGMLTVYERADVLDRIAMGDTGILFVAPEQFRNAAFIKAIAQRQISGWVFDEAHCLSKWGHDFRPDYLYAAKFIAARSEKDGYIAPIGCFTATAKPDVLQEITAHFRDTLGITFKQFIGSNERDNLFYEVLPAEDDKARQADRLLHAGLGDNDGGAVVFVARKKSAEQYAEYLRGRGWPCAHFHAGLAAGQKADIQERFIRGELRVIVATNAFGMGVDKPDVRLVIHADITGSPENYLQEAGRAGRNRESAKCILLYDRRDVDAQFSLERRAQLEWRDLQGIWKKLGALHRMVGRQTAEEALVVTGGDILHESGASLSFDSDDRQADTKVRTALAWLERAELLERSENRTRIFPSCAKRLPLARALQIIAGADLRDSLKALYRNITEILYNTPDGVRLSTDELGKATACSFGELRGHLYKLAELGILTNETRMTVILRTDNVKPSTGRLQQIIRWEERLWDVLQESIPDADRRIRQYLTLSALCHRMHEASECGDIVPADIALLLQTLAHDKAVDSNTHSGGSFEIENMGNDTLSIRFRDGSNSWEDIRKNAADRRHISRNILTLLVGKTGGERKKDLTVETGMDELLRHLAEDPVREARHNDEALLNRALLYLHRLDVIRINHGMTLLRQAMTIRLNPQALAERRRYLKADYRPLATFYEEKRFQMHVMQEYAWLAQESMAKARDFVRDYFNTEKKQFKNKWFKNRGAMLEESVSAETLRSIIDTLNGEQKAVVTDKDDRNLLILAGPGSGKTRVIVHRVAYLLRVRHIDPAAIIVLAFNRHAAKEIRRRLHALAGDIAAAVTVLTYDGMAMRLLGVRLDDTSGDNSGCFKQWCRDAAALLAGAPVPGTGEDDDARERILAGFRYILVDEYQDICEEHYQLVCALAGRQTDEDAQLTILAVGDDDQNIYAFNGTSNDYIHRFCADYKVDTPDDLTNNYRSSKHIIRAANRLIEAMPGRLKSGRPIHINAERQDEADGGRWENADSERRGQVRIIRLPPANGVLRQANIQAQAVIAEIRRLQQFAPIDYGDIAVLARNNAALAPMQSWCEQNAVPYRLGKDQRRDIRLRRRREFVRLLDAVGKNAGLDSAAFAALIRQQKTGGYLRDYFGQMADDFLLDYPPGGNTEHGTIFLRAWLNDYVGNDSGDGNGGIFLSTAHGAKGLEYKHVFILDDAWKKDPPDEQRLYYVAMTRAGETLTLLQQRPQYPWRDLLSPVCECVCRQYREDSRLNIRYHTLSLSRPAELDLDFLARDRNPRHPRLDRTIRDRLRQVAALEAGDPLTLHRGGDGNYYFHCRTAEGGSIAVACTSHNARLPAAHTMPAVRAVVAGFSVRYRKEVEENYLAKIPAQLEKWAVVIPTLIIPAPADDS